MKKYIPFPVIALILLGCSTLPQADFDPEAFTDREPSAADNTPYDRFIKYMGVENHYANLHAHHYMERTDTESSIPTSGPCPKFKNFPQDDGRPCLANEAGEPQIVTPPSAASGKVDPLDYFRLTCDFAKEKGDISIVMISAHSKTGKDQDTDTRVEGFINRHKALKEINDKYDGKFYCGLGQEASSISKGNHVNIFGHMPAAKADITQPFYFQAGAFDVFYPEVKARRASGERVILQFNHPDVLADLYFGTLNLDEATRDMDPKQVKRHREKMKEGLNDYGIDDFQPLACVLPKGAGTPACVTGEPAADRASMDLIKKTFQTIRDNGGDAYRLIEVTETGVAGVGATTNSAEKFLPVHARNNNAEQTRKPEGVESGLLAYIFYLNMGFKISPTANQDNHFMNPGSALTSRTGVLTKSLGENEVFDALENRRTFATEDRNAKILLAARDSKNKLVMMGSDVKVTGDKAVIYFGYSDADESEPVNVRIYSYHEDDQLVFDRQRPLGAIRTIQFKPEGATLPEGEAEPIDLKDGVANGRVKGLRIPVKKGRTTLFVEYTQNDQDKIWSAPLFIEAN